MRVIVEAHNPNWLTTFTSIRNDLQLILKDIPIRSIEHVGSTSVPGLPAKPVLDINIVVTPEYLTAARDALVGAGYEDRGEMGIPGRFALRQPPRREVSGAGEAGNWSRSSGEVDMKRNTYVVLDGCLSLRNHRDLKRMLLENEDLKREYGEVKMALAAREVEDIDEYCRAKTEVIINILRRAGWSEEDLAEVAKANL